MFVLSVLFCFFLIQLSPGHFCVLQFVGSTIPLIICEYITDSENFVWKMLHLSPWLLDLVLKFYRPDESLTQVILESSCSAYRLFPRVVSSRAICYTSGMLTKPADEKAK